MTIAQNINVLHKKPTPLLAVLISSECAGAERGVLAVGLVPAAGVYRGSWCTCSGCLYLQRGIPACDVPVAGLLKLALLRISTFCAKGLPRYWQFKLSQSTPEQKEVYLQGGLYLQRGFIVAVGVPAVGVCTCRGVSRHVMFQ